MEKQQSKKPLIRFPEFKDAWEHKRLNELLSEAKKRNEDLKYGKKEVLSVSGELGIVNQIEHLGRSYAGVSVHQYHVVEVGDIVYTKSPLKANPFGIIKLNKGKAGIVSTLYAVYKVNLQTAYGPFIDYYFSLDANTNRYLRPLVKKGAKNDMKINNAYVLHDRIFAPAIPEQKRIASFLTVLDKKITELKQKKNLLEQYKKGVMQKLFSQELRFKDENGKEFPKWENKKLSSLCEIVGGGTPETNKLEYWSGNIQWFTPTEIKSDYVSKSIRTITELGLQKSSAKKLPIGAILLTTRATIGEASIALEECTTNQGFQSLIVKEGNINVFLFNWIKINKHELVSRANGSTFPEISKSEISKIIVPTPCKLEQTKIASFLFAIDEKINRTENQMQQTQKYKKGLLQKMFI
jgi:type I restriction enzyme S subunit